MANEAKHTPGPWKLHNPTVDALAVHTPAGSIAEWPTNYCPQDLADARLIAAAPDLLAFVRELAEGRNATTRDLPPSIRRDARLLLAKALAASPQ